MDKREEEQADYMAVYNENWMDVVYVVVRVLVPLVISLGQQK